MDIIHNGFQLYLKSSVFFFLYKSLLEVFLCMRAIVAKRFPPAIYRGNLDYFCTLLRARCLLPARMQRSDHRTARKPDAEKIINQCALIIRRMCFIWYVHTCTTSSSPRPTASKSAYSNYKRIPDVSNTPFQVLTMTKVREIGSG